MSDKVPNHARVPVCLALTLFVDSVHNEVGDQFSSGPYHALKTSYRVQHE